MKTNLNLEKCLWRATPSLREKMRASIDVLQSGEKIALKYEPDKGFALGFSGGKDSQALYHIAELSGVKFHAFFAPTTIDPPEVIRFIRRNYPEVEIIQPKQSIYKAALKHKMLPISNVRWCCAEFKELWGGSIVLTGVRKEESVKRAKRREFEVLKHKFSGNFTEFEQWQEQQRVKHLKASVNQDKFSSNKKSEVRCINGKDRIVINPILEWTNRDVWEFLNSVVRVPHCELYDQGFTRIGCIGCPMASRRERINQLNRYPYVKQKWLEVLRKMPLKKYDMTAEEVLEWWLSNQSLSQYAQSLNQTTIDYNEYDTQ